MPSDVHGIGERRERGAICFFRGCLFAAITHLRLVVEYYHIIPNKNVSCRIFCDSKAALARVADKYYDGFGTTWRCRTHYDLEVAIRTCLLQLPISISWQWVKGHASRRIDPADFTFPELPNETADGLATLARQSQDLTQTDDDHWPEQTVSIIGPRGRMCGRLARELRYCCTASDLISYWRDRFHWSESQVALVDILGTQKALANCLLTRSSAFKSSGADGYQSIGGWHVRTLTA
jgi:hypothetical protein